MCLSANCEVYACATAKIVVKWETNFFN